MYERFYGLRDDPFRLLPDPHVCFPHQSCAKAWAYLRYAIQRREGIVVVTGPPGTGKTTLGERLVNELDTARTVSVRLVARDLNATELLRRLAYAFGMAAESMDRAMLTYRIDSHLTDLERKDGSTVVLLVDEAQTLSGQALEALRVLTDLQSLRSKPLLQLFLLGQEELEDVIGAPGMEQFRQRVIASCRLHTMDLAETKAYLEYRLNRVDWRGDPSIDGAAVHTVFRHSGGLPRHVNKICSRLLLYGCAEEKHQLGESDVLAVVRDLTDELLTPAQPAAQADPAPAPFASLEELALVASEDARADTATLQTDAQTLHLSEPPPEADAPPDAEVHQASPPPQYRDSSHMSSRRRLRSHSRHLLHSLRHRIRALPRWLELRRAQLRVTAPAAATTLLGLARRLAERLAASAADAKPRLSEWRRRLSAAVESRPLRQQSVLMAFPVVGLLAGGLLLWIIQDGEQVQTNKLAMAKYQSLPPSVSRITQATRADVLRRWADHRTPDVYFTSTSVPLAQLIPHDAAVSRTIERRIVGSSARVPERAALATQTAGVPWILGVAGSGLEPQVTVDRAGRMPVLAPQTPRKVSREAPPSTSFDQPDKPSSRIPVQDATATVTPSASVAREPAAPAVLAIATPDEDDFTRMLPPTGAGSPSPEPTLDVAGPAVTFEPAIQAASVTAPGIESLPADPGVEDSEQTRIEQLLGLADTAIERNRLLIPEATSAYHYLQKVLAIDPENPQARAGLERVVRRYNDKARKALDGGDYQMARRFVSRALRVNRHNPRARALRAKIDAAESREREEALAALEAARKAELERMAAEAKAAEPVAAKAPPRDSRSGFERIMKLLDGV